MGEQRVQRRTVEPGQEVETASSAVACVGAGPDVEALAGELVVSESRRGLDLTGEGGLLTALTRQVLQTALEAGLTAHLGYEKHERGRGGGNARNGSTPKTVTTEIGKVTVDVPRDRAGTFEPQIVKKHQRRMSGFDDAVVSLYAKGMATGDIVDHLSEVYDTDVYRDLVSRVTSQVLDEMKRWQARPLDPVFPHFVGGAPTGDPDRCDRREDP